MEVSIRKWTPDDRGALMEISNKVNRQYISNRLPYPYTEKDADWWLDFIREKEGTGGVFRAVTADGRPVGNISVERKSDVYEKDGEIGYLLLEECWSKGIMTEAVRQICETAFEELDLLRITGHVYEPNTASRRVLEKNGFVQEGLMKNAVYKEGQVYNLCIYGKCR